jgi:type I restriction enzyme R subunit
MMGGTPEKETRKNINGLLEDSGWRILKRGETIPDKGAFASEEYPTSSGPADYVLLVDGNIIGIVEAKKSGEPVYGVLTQAQRYATDIEGTNYNFADFKVPFIYSTNGQDVYFQDLRYEDSISRKVLTFHTPEALLEFLDLDYKESKLWLANNPNEDGYLRYYQREAIQAIEMDLQRNKRKMLLAMATGTGKTVTIISLLYRMLKSGMFKRILFLVDRIELANQALGVLASYEPEPGQKFDRIYEVFCRRILEGREWKSLNINTRLMPESKISDPQPNDAYVFVATIQSMYRLLTGEEEPEKEIEADEWGNDVDKINFNPKIPIHAFDLIISDECHRSIYNKWKVVLDYFDAVQIGLTATPAAHTYAYFDSNLAYTYPLEKAIQDGYLVDYDVVHIDTKITMEGITLKGGRAIKVEDDRTKEVFDTILGDEIDFEPREIERKITAIDRNRKIVKDFAKYFEENQKTLVFAVDDKHADQLVRLFRNEYSEKGDKFVQKITYKVDKAPDRIKEFRNREYPVIAITVDMLTTGVDIPKIENLVFVRPVQSRILFEQMMGRGTRRCDEINKTHFTVFDTLRLLEFMKEHNLSDFVEPPGSQYMKIREVIKSIKRGFRREENIDVLVAKLQRIAKNVSEEGVEEFAKYIPEGDIVKFASSLKEDLKKDFTKAFEIFENPAFLDLLENYPRKKRFFLIDELTQDRVLRSEEALTTIDGEEIKPKDYLKAFEEFVTENEDEIEALKILMERPADFDIKDLRKLREVLAKQPQIFTEERLRRAAHNQLADIISFIHSAAKHVPLISAEERVEMAFRRIKRDREFSEKQEKWLELIKKHVIKNLIIKEQDFKEQLLFSRKGTWEDWNSTFDHKLLDLIGEINAEVLSI